MIISKIKYFNLDGKIRVERIKEKVGRDYITVSGKIVRRTLVYLWEGETELHETSTPQKRLR